MKLETMTELDLLFPKQSISNKKEILDQLAQALKLQGYISDVESFLNAVDTREKQGPTGMENGLAIPHGKSPTVTKAGFAVMTLEKSLAPNQWDSIEQSNRVDLIFLLAIPDNEANSTHLKLLSELSKHLMDPEFIAQLKSAQTAEQLYQVIKSQDKSTTTDQQTSPVENGTLVLAITSCATGIAHTYMAAEALEKAAQELGVNIQVEKQGANGIENRLTSEWIQKADGIIFAVDTKIKEKERFVGLPFVEVKVAEPLKRSSELIEQVLTNPQGKVLPSDNNSSANTEFSPSKKSVKEEIMAAVMTGISYMIPLLVAAGLMLGIAKLIWILILGLDPAAIGSVDYNSIGGMKGFLHYLDGFGNMLFKFIYPIFGMFAAYSIADRSGLIAGFSGGLFAAGLHYTFFGIEGGIPSGFLGALALGLAAGYISRFLNEKIKLHKNLSAMKPMFLIPGLSVLAIFILNLFIVDPIFGQLNQFIANTITSMSGSGQLGLSAIIAAATSFDLGGPVNKAAGAIAIGLATDEIFPLTARVLAIVIPPLGLGLSTMIDKYVVGRHVYPQDLRVAGGTSFLLGFLAISEGAIPFMLRNPLITIPINIIGSIIGACTAVSLGAVQWLPLPAIWGWPLVTNIPAYLFGLLVGTLFIAFGNIFVRYYLIKKHEKQGEKITD